MDRTSTDTAARIAAWRLVTAGLGIPAGACACALCGDSPHPAAKSVREFLPAHFPHPDLIDPERTEVCAGCVKIFGGKPSSIDPPVRTRHVLVREDGAVSLHLRTSELYSALVDPEGARLLSWSTSLKKHHLVYARPRSSSVLYIGSDNKTLAYGAAERGLIPVIAELLTGFRSDTIIAGSYSPMAIGAFGANRWAALETRVEELRRRSPLLLQLMTYATPNPEREEAAERTEDMAPSDSAAAYLLGEIAHASDFRRTDGLMFWKGFFVHRLQRFGRLDLPALVSRLMTDCRVQTHQAEGVTSVLRSIEDDGQAEAVSRAIRERPSLLAALAYDHVQQKRVKK